MLSGSKRIWLSEYFETYDINYTGSIKEVLQYDEHLGYKIDPGPRGHILKNPNLPDADEYIPVLFMRHSSEDYFAFLNVETGKKEVLLGGRSFIYPKGKVPRNAININI